MPGSQTNWNISNDIGAAVLSFGAFHGILSVGQILACAARMRTERTVKAFRLVRSYREADALSLPRHALGDTQECLGNQWHPVGPVMAAAREHAHAVQLPAADESEAVMLDFIGSQHPVGTVVALVGKHGSMKPGGRRTGPGLCQCIIEFVAPGHTARESRRERVSVGSAANRSAVADKADSSDWGCKCPRFPRASPSIV